MATITRELQDGLTIGDKKHTRAEIREYTAGDLIDASSAAERVVYTDAGPVFVTSPTLMDMELMTRQVVRIGEHKGPLSIAELRKLSGRDLMTLQMMVKALDSGAANEVASRGRSDGSQGAD